VHPLRKQMRDMHNNVGSTGIAGQMSFFVFTKKKKVEEDKANK